MTKLDQDQQLQLAKVASHVQKKKAEQETTVRESQADELRRFIGDLDLLLGRGINIEGIEAIDVLTDTITKFGQSASIILDEIIQRTASLHELTLPDKIEFRQVTDKKLLDALAKAGDTSDLSQKLLRLDETIRLLSVAVNKTDTQGQTPKDFTPVRIVLGSDDALAFLERWPIPQFGSRATDITPIKGLALGEYDQIIATYPSSSSELYTYKLAGVTTHSVLVTYTTSAKTVLDSVVKT